MDEAVVRAHPEPWNKGKLVGQKAPFKLKEIWAIRVRLQLFRRARDLALFDLGIDSKLRACDLVRLKVRDICHGDRVAARAIVMQQKTSRPVQFEITESTTNFGRCAHVHREMRLNMTDKFWYSGRKWIGLICPLLAFRAMVRNCFLKIALG